MIRNAILTTGLAIVALLPPACTNLQLSWRLS